MISPATLENSPGELMLNSPGELMLKPGENLRDVTMTKKQQMVQIKADSSKTGVTGGI